MKDFMNQIYLTNITIHNKITQEFYTALALLIDKNYTGFLQYMDRMELLCSSGTMWKITVQYYKTFLIALFEMGEYYKIESIAKRLLAKCRVKEDQNQMMYCHEMLAKVSSKQNNHAGALKYYFKVLKTALRLKNYTKELKCYDKIGMMYFHLNKVEKAEYYHRRMMESKIEGDKSNLRSLPFKKQDPKKLEKYLASKQVNKRLPSDSETSDDNNSELFYAPVKEPKRKEILRAGYSSIQNDSGFDGKVVGNVNIFAKNTMTEKMYIAHYYKRIVNLQNSSLTHKSTNRALDNHDSNCCANKNKDLKDYRFRKYYSKIGNGNHRRIHHSMMSLKKMIDHGRQCLEDLLKILDCDESERMKFTKINSEEIENKKGRKLPRLGARVYKSQVLSKNKRRKAGVGMSGIYKYKEDMEVGDNY